MNLLKTSEEYPAASGDAPTSIAHPNSDVDMRGYSPVGRLFGGLDYVGIIICKIDHKQGPARVLSQVLIGPRKKASDEPTADSGAGGDPSDSSRITHGLQCTRLPPVPMWRSHLAVTRATRRSGAKGPPSPLLGDEDGPPSPDSGKAPGRPKRARARRSDAAKKRSPSRQALCGRPGPEIAPCPGVAVRTGANHQPHPRISLPWSPAPAP